MLNLNYCFKNSLILQASKGRFLFPYHWNFITGFPMHLKYKSFNFGFESWHAFPAHSLLKVTPAHSQATLAFYFWKSLILSCLKPALPLKQSVGRPLAPWNHFRKDINWIMWPASAHSILFLSAQHPIDFCKYCVIKASLLNCRFH